MADGCLLLLEDGSGFLLLESPSLRLEDGSGDMALEDGAGLLSLEAETLGLEHGGDLELEEGGALSVDDDDSDGRLLLEACPPGDAFGGWAEPATVREQETDLVVAVIHSLRRRRRLTVG